MGRIFSLCFLALTALTLFNAAGAFSYQQYEHFGKFVVQSRWMKDFETSNIFDLVLPASHNSGTGYYCGDAVGEDLAKCQYFTIPLQLKYGIRFLDIRTSMFHLDEEPQIRHNYFTFSSLARAFDDVITFLHDHPTEVVVMQVVRESSFFDFAARAPEDHEISWIVHVINRYRDFCVSSSDAERLSLKRLRESGKRLILITPFRDIDFDLGERKYVESKWANTDDVSNLKSYMKPFMDGTTKRPRLSSGDNPYMPSNPHPRKFFWIKGETTSNLGNPKKHASEVLAMVNDLMDNVPKHSHWFNVLSTDFVHGEIIAKTIALNRKGDYVTVIEHYLFNRRDPLFVSLMGSRLEMVRSKMSRISIRTSHPSGLTTLQCMETGRYISICNRQPCASNSPYNFKMINLSNGPVGHLRKAFRDPHSDMYLSSNHNGYIELQHQINANERFELLPIYY